MQFMKLALFFIRETKQLILVRYCLQRRSVMKWLRNLNNFMYEATAFLLLPPTRRRLCDHSVILSVIL